MIPINQLIEKITIASDNGDQRMIFYLVGKISEILLSYEPIEDAALDQNQGTMMNMLKTIELFSKL